MANEFIARNGIISKSNLVVSGSLTALSTITAQTLVVQTITSSISSITGSTNFGTLSSNTHTFTGSILTSGSISIGTNAPTGSLDIRGLASFGDVKAYNSIQLVQSYNNPTVQSWIWTSTDGQLNLGTGSVAAGNTIMTLANGKVGIGTSSPSAKLDITDANGIPLRIGDISAAPSSQTAGYIGMSTFAFSGNNGDLVLYPRTSAASKILLMGGNVGIGTTNPASQLHISAPANTTAEFRIVGYNYGSTYNTTLRSTVGSVGVLQFGNNGDNYIMAGNTGTGGYLVFKVNCTAENTTSGTEAMRITSAGALTKYISAIDTYSEMHYNIVASGGTTATVTANGATYKTHTFTSTGTFTVYGYGLVEILVVAGGGGGGWDVGGGGGAGGYVETSTFVNTGAYTITVGAGAGGSGTPGGTAGSGGQSTALGFVALGGGGGGNYTSGVGGNGANGGGGAGYSGGYVTGGTGTFRQGNAGGPGRADLYGTGATGGGGGGAAAAGAQSSNDISGYALGGAGVVSWITGTNATYCKGGAGGGDNWGGATDGAANTGNGGDGAGNPNTGKNGGSGIVIIRYKV
jgi:hypothetical protein